MIDPLNAHHEIFGGIDLVRAEVSGDPAALLPRNFYQDLFLVKKSSWFAINHSVDVDAEADGVKVVLTNKEGQGVQIGQFVFRTKFSSYR